MAGLDAIQKNLFEKAENARRKDAVMPLKIWMNSRKSSQRIPVSSKRCGAVTEPVKIRSKNRPARVSEPFRLTKNRSNRTFGQCVCCGKPAEKIEAVRKSLLINISRKKVYYFRNYLTTKQTDPARNIVISRYGSSAGPIFVDAGSFKSVYVVSGTEISALKKIS